MSNDVSWPDGWERRPARERGSGSQFDVTLPKAFSDLEKELERMGVDSFTHEFEGPSRKKDGRPYSNHSPDDPVYLLRWSMDGYQYAIGCDKYDDFRSNVRSVGLYVKEKRMMENRPVTTGKDEFTNLRLPSGKGETKELSPHQVLGVSPDASRADIEDAFKERAKTCHPDLGGTEEAFKRLKNARDAMLLQEAPQ